MRAVPKREEKTIAKNRRAFHDYEILETYEAGIELTGTEVRSLRENNCQLTDCFALIRNGEVWLNNVHISPYSNGSIFNPDPDRRRKLLLHKKQIRYLDAKVAEAKQKLLESIKRSVYVYRVDCGGCNGCEIEIFATITAVFDAERFGIKVVPSPRHADMLIYTGAMTRSMREPALRAYHAAPDPKIVMSYGACGCTGGIFHDNYCVWGGTDPILPVDVYVPGCPPSPPATIFGFATALGLLDQKLHASHHVAPAGEQAPVAFPAIPYKVRTAFEREARRMSGYYYGKQIVDEFMLALSKDTVDALGAADALIAAETDTRKRAVFMDLKALLLSKVVDE